MVIKSGISLYFVTNEEAVTTLHSILHNLYIFLCNSEVNIAKYDCISETRRASAIKFCYNVSQYCAEIKLYLILCGGYITVEAHSTAAFSFVLKCRPRAQIAAKLIKS